jgi:adenylate cyclase
MSYKRFLPTKVASKFLIIGALFAILTGGSIGLLSYITTENIISERMQKVDVENLLSEKTSQIQEVINSAVKVSRMLASDQTLNDWFLGNEQNTAQREIILEQLRYVANDLDYPIVFAVNAKTNNYWTQRLETAKKLSPNKQTDIWFYDNLKKSAGTVILELDDSAFLGGTYIFINVIMGKPGARAIGVAGIGFPVEQLIKEFIHHDFDSHATIKLVNREGIIQVAEDKAELGKNVKAYLPYHIAKELFYKQNGITNIEYEDPDLGTVIIGAKPIQGTPWLTLVEIAKDQWLFSTLKPVQIGMLYSGLIAIFLISLLIGIITKFRVGQLVSISKAISALGNNDFSINLDQKILDRRDEIGDMAKGYEQTRQNLNNAYKHNETLLQNLEATVEERTYEIQHINEVARAINSTLNLDDIMLSLLEKLQEVMRFNQIGIFMLKNNKNVLKATNYIGEGINPGRLADIKQINIPINRQNRLAKALLDEKIQYLDFPDDQAINKLSKEVKALYYANPVKSLFILPLIVQRKTIGTIVFAHTKKMMKLNEETQNKVLRYVVQIANAIQNAQLYSDLKSTRLKLLETEKIAVMTKAFERFVPQQFLDRLAKTGVEDVEVGMVQCGFITVLFSDIRSFTNLSESMTPQDLLLFLNSYLARMNSIIANNNGFIDKFIGDAIMGIFDQKGEEQFKSEDNIHEAYLAVSCAIEMHQNLHQYNIQRKQKGELPVEIGIGIHSGPVVVGTVGSEDRLQTTVLGDTVNTSSRLESITKMYNAKIIISEQTYRFIKSESKFLIRPLDYLRVKGKEEAMHIYEVINADSETTQDLKGKTLLRYQTALDHYYKQEWHEAQQLFNECLTIFPDDVVVQRYLKRIEAFKESPPGSDWSGIFVAPSK